MNSLLIIVGAVALLWLFIASERAYKREAQAERERAAALARVEAERQGEFDGGIFGPGGED